jgi:hypothetical protein
MDTFTGILAAPGLLKKVAALKQKSAGSAKRIEGELPSAPPVAGDVPEWWDETTTVLDRIRTETNVSLNTVESKVAETEVSLSAVDSKINASNIKKLYEENADTNNLTDYLKNRLENLEDALGIEGKAVGTETKQILNNKTTDGGFF